MARFIRNRLALGVASFGALLAADARGDFLQLTESRYASNYQQVQPYGTATAPDMRILVGESVDDYLQVTDSNPNTPANFSISYSGSPNIELFSQSGGYPNNPVASMTGTIYGASTLVPILYSSSTVGTSSGQFTFSGGGNLQFLQYNVSVEDAPDLIANNSTTLDATSGPVQLSLQDPTGSSALRADARVGGPYDGGFYHTYPSVSGPFSMSGGMYSGQVLAADQIITSNVSFVPNTNLLNGTYTGTVSVPMAANISLEQLSSPYSPVETWNVSGTVTGKSSITVPAGQPYNGISASDGSTYATLLDGSASAGSSTAVSIVLNTGATPFGFSPVGTTVSLSGTAGTVFAFAINFTAAQAQAAGLGAQPLVKMQWYDPVSQTWEDAVLGNSQGTPTEYANETYASFLSQAGGTLTSADLGSEGYYYNSDGSGQVWAVLDHNSEFSAGTAAVPEPASALLLLVPLLALGRRRASMCFN